MSVNLTLGACADIRDLALNAALVLGRPRLVCTAHRGYGRLYLNVLGQVLAGVRMVWPFSCGIGGAGLSASIGWSRGYRAVHIGFRPSWEVLPPHARLSLNRDPETGERFGFAEAGLLGFYVSSSWKRIK